MFTDAHCHPLDLGKIFPGAEVERRRLGILCAANACVLEEFEYIENLARQSKTEGAPSLLPCFALHPQLPAALRREGRDCGTELLSGLAALETLAGQGRLTAVGETGFDLFNGEFRETETIQESLFAAHLEIALRHGLPLLLHVRRAMHKVFARAGLLKKCRAVIFHSWPGTEGEGKALLKKGVNAFFSFGTTIMLNHLGAMRCCALFPAERLLAETDAPYQPLRGQAFSRWEDLPRIVAAAAALRREAGTDGCAALELASIIEGNFRRAFGA
jgi:TatD DNase family protein